MSINGGAINSYAINASSHNTTEPEDVVIEAVINGLWSEFYLETTDSLYFTGALPRLAGDFVIDTGFKFSATLPGLDSTFNLSSASVFGFENTLPGLDGDISINPQNEVSFDVYLPKLSAEINLDTNSQLSISARIPSLIGDIYLAEPDNLFFTQQLPSLMGDFAFQDDFSFNA